jgi:hypothetical protein
MSQCRIIYDYLKARGSITTLEAFRLGVCRLSERIRELESGYWGWMRDTYPQTKVKIKRERVRVKTRTGYTTVMRYSLDRFACKNYRT